MEELDHVHVALKVCLSHFPRLSSDMQVHDWRFPVSDNLLRWERPLLTCTLEENTLNAYMRAVCLSLLVSLANLLSVGGSLAESLDHIALKGFIYPFKATWFESFQLNHRQLTAGWQASSVERKSITSSHTTKSGIVARTWHNLSLLI